MEATYRIHRDDNLAVVTLNGPAEADFFISFYPLLLDDPLFRPGMAIIWDAHDVIIDQRDPVGLQRVGEFIQAQAEKRGKGKSALVAPSDLNYGTTRVFMSLFHQDLPIELMVFRTMEEARAWTSDDGGPC